MELISWFALRSGFYSPLCSKYTTQFTLRTLIFLTLSTRASIIVERLVYSVWNVYVSRFVGCWMFQVGLGPDGAHQVLNVECWLGPRWRSPGIECWPGPRWSSPGIECWIFLIWLCATTLKGLLFCLALRNMQSVAGAAIFPMQGGEYSKAALSSCECNILSEHVLPTKIFKFSWNTEISFLIKNDYFYKEERNTRTKVLKVS